MVELDDWARDKLNRNTVKNCVECHDEQYDRDRFRINIRNRNNNRRFH